MDIKKKTIRKLVNDLDRNGTELMMSVLRTMDSEDTYYTSLLAKNLRHTWANTYKAVNKLMKLDLVKTAAYFGAYNSQYDNVKGLVLTRKGQMVRSEIVKKKRAGK
jgi:Mn-dependent DtxR family transcriptional regulator